MFWNNTLHRGLRWTLHNKRTLAILWTVLVAGAVMLGSQLRVDNRLIEDLREDDPFRRQFVFFENEFAGVRPFELSVTLSRTSRSRNPSSLDSLEQYLQASYGVGALLGPATAIRMATGAEGRSRGIFFHPHRSANPLKNTCPTGAISTMGHAYRKQWNRSACVWER